MPGWAARAQPTPGRPPLRLPASLFSASFGLAGLAQCWSTAAGLTQVSGWPGDALWILTAAVWLVTVVGYTANVVTDGRWRTQLRDSIYAPFLSLVFIVPMLFGIALHRPAPVFGEVVFLVALTGTVLLGAWLTAEWIMADMQLAQWHPGYFLPTVAGGLIASAGSAAIGLDGLARLMFGYGIICWLVLGSILLLRLFTQPPLPAPLVPTIAIEVAPSAVAGNAWFQINGGRGDTVVFALSGYGLLLVLVQLRLIPLYLRVPFGPGSWAFAFSYAAAFTVAIRWLAVEHIQQQRAWTFLLLAVISVGIGVLAVRTVVDLVHGIYLPRAQPG